MPRGAQCAFKDLMSHSSAIRITYRISLRSSSLQEPRYPLLKVVISLLVLADRGVRTRRTPSILEFSLTTGVGVFGVLVWGEKRLLLLTDLRRSVVVASPLASSAQRVWSKRGASRTLRCVQMGRSHHAATESVDSQGWVGSGGAGCPKAAAHSPWLIASPRRRISPERETWRRGCVAMILPQVHLRKPCYDFTFL